MANQNGSSKGLVVDVPKMPYLAFCKFFKLARDANFPQTMSRGCGVWNLRYFAT